MTIYVFRNNGRKQKLSKEEAKRYDDTTAFFKNVKFKVWSIVDVATGLEVARGKTKKEMIENYNSLKPKYEEMMASETYAKLVQRYNEEKGKIEND